MDEQTAFVLALQLVALFSIAGALLLYLLCKIQSPARESNPEALSTVSVNSAGGAGRSILITSCDTALGLQTALHLAERGFRVFAGCKPTHNHGDDEQHCSLVETDSVRIIRAWQKHQESATEQPHHGNGSIVALPVDVTREDVLHDALDIIRAHLPAGQDGIWAVLYTNGVTLKGRLEQQDITHWDALFKTNVSGLLRTSRTFMGLLRPTRGRLVTFPHVTLSQPNSVACTATQHAVNGASQALRRELNTQGIHVVALQPARHITLDAMYATPKITGQQQVLTHRALHVLEMALTHAQPKPNYVLNNNSKWLPFLTK